MNSAQVQRVHLMVAQVRCLGAARDSLLVSEVQHFLEGTGKNPLHRQGQLQQILDIHSRLATSGYSSGGSFQQEAEGVEGAFYLPASLQGSSQRDLRAGVRNARRTSLCLELPDVMREAVATAVNAQTGVVSSLSMALPLDRTIRKGRAANSTIRDKLGSWLQSHDGKQWQAEREAIFGSDAQIQENRCFRKVLKGFRI